MKFHFNWDALGATATVACAIHCALLPLFLTSLPLFGINIIHNLFFEAAMILLAFVIGSFSLLHGFQKHHHKFGPLFLFSFGMSFLVAKQFWLQHTLFLLLPAVGLIVFAHFMNWRYCRLAKHCHADDCNH